MIYDIPMRAETPTKSCPYCNSGAVVRYGSYKNVQRYWCKSCARKFRAGAAGCRMRTPPQAIGTALELFYGGLDPAQIREKLDHQFACRPTKKSIFKWVYKYTAEAVKSVSGLRPLKNGETWIADETVIRINGQKVWIFDLQNEGTRFLLSSMMLTSRSQDDAYPLFQAARETSGRLPSEIISDSYVSYPAGFLSLKDNTRINLEIDIQRTLIFHATLRDRTTVLKKFKSLDTASLFLRGWLVHYNFFRPHEGLNGKTPAEQSGISAFWRNWGEVVRGEGMDGHP